VGKEFTDLGVLVVDDDASIVRLLKMMLMDLGIDQIFTAADGRSALDFLGAMESEIDIIICDWNMPRMTGLELLQQVRTVNPDIRFIMLTGRADMESVTAARDHGVDSYLLKPFTPEQLRQRLEHKRAPRYGAAATALPA
jgi:two-component system chemotaxis response regulator CheY